MKIGLTAPAAQFPDAIFAGLENTLSSHTVVRVAAKDVAQAGDLRVLVTAGPVTRELMTSLPQLALVQTISDGYETIDVEAATELGVRVSNAPADLTGNSDSVAEFAILLMLATARNLPLALAALHDSRIEKPGRNRTLLGSQVCVVGMGMIGRKIAHRLQPFEVSLLAVDRSPDHVPPHITAYPMDRLKEAVSAADFVVLSVRATNENVHMIDAGVLRAMKPGAILINVARGSLVDEKALFDAVKSGHLSAAGLDVEEHEPVPPDDPLLTLPQIFITPHEAGLTELNIRGTTEHIVDVIRRLESGEPIPSQVNQPGEANTEKSR